MALQDTEHKVNPQMFRMVLCGVPRSGKSTFWKRIAVEGFKPSEESASTGAAESYFISAIGREKQNVLNFHSRDGDLDSEALATYKLILERYKQNKPTPLQEPQTSMNETPVQEHRTSEKHSIDADTLKVDKSLQPAEKNEPDNSPKDDSAYGEIPVALATTVQQTEVLLKGQQSDPIIVEINKRFDELNDLLVKSTDLIEILNIKKTCHLQDTGGQRAFLELIPTLSTGKALYVIFFSYKDFEKNISETVQTQGNPEEFHTGIQYDPIDVIMQSLICVSTEFSDNVALLVGTHVDEVTAKDVSHADEIIHERVKPFLKNRSLVCADEENMILKVAIKENDLCSNDPSDYVNVIMDIVDSELKYNESEKLLASWNMLCIMLRRFRSDGYSVLRYSHCQHIAKQLYIPPSMLQGVLARLHTVFGVVLYFPEVKGLEDIVICDPDFVYKSISELIFESFRGFRDVELLKKLKIQGMFKYQDLKKRHEIKRDLELHKLIILLKHLGVIAPIGRSNTAQIADSEYDESDNEDIHPDQEYVIPCVLKEAKLHELDIELENTHVCSIVPLRIYFDCGYSPMGGFCYLFTKLISDKGWELCISDENEDENNIYWRNKVSFDVEFDSRNYLVTLFSTEKYYQIHILHSKSKQPFQLLQDGHSICKHVWNAIHTTLKKSPNKSLQAYKVACICTVDHSETGEHVMKFECKPHDNLPEIKACCEKSKACYPPLHMQPSVMVWFKVR